MMKKFLLTLMMSLFLFNPATAGTLTFSHPSVMMHCLDQDSARHLAEVAQKRTPIRLDIGTCLPAQGFGGQIKTEHLDKFVLVSPIMEDWEGDQFAIFTIDFSNTTYWLIVYNPARIINMVGISA